MRLTSNYSWPVAEPTDARRDFPSVVDGPRSDAIDSELAAVDSRAVLATALVDTFARGTFATQSIPNAAETNLAPTVSDSDGVGLVGQDLTIDARGIWMVTATITTATIPTNTRAFLSIRGPRADTGLSQDQVARASFGYNENQTAASGLFFNAGPGGRLTFSVYHVVGAAANFGGFFVVKRVSGVL